MIISNCLDIVANVSTVCFSLNFLLFAIGNETILLAGWSYTDEVREAWKRGEELGIRTVYLFFERNHETHQNFYNNSTSQY